MMALSGVRISWEILARKSDFADEARSAVRLALSRSSSARFHCVMSRSTAQNFGMPTPTGPMVMNSGISPPWRTRPITSRPSFSTLATPFLVSAQRDFGVSETIGRGGAHQHEHQRAFSLPRHRIEAAFAGERVAGARRDREGLAGAVDAVERAGLRIDHEALEPARGRDRREIR